MRNKIILRLFLIIAFATSMYSCIHDETLALSDPTSKEYTSKSLWKEDEKYIKNVMKIYQENEFKIKKNSGTPYWSYSTTTNRYDESFLMVPVVENGKVVSVLQVPRHQDKVYFVYTFSEPDIMFFQNLLSSRLKKVAKTVNEETSKLTCSTLSYSVWLPDSEANPDPSSGSGHWETYHVTRCSFSQITECVGIVSSDGTCQDGGGGYDYPTGGGTGSNPSTSTNPCTKTKAILASPQVQAKVSELKTQSKIGGEIGVKIKADGTTSVTIPGGGHDVELGDTAGYQGGYHNHTPTGIKMLSPPDIVKMLDFAMAQPNGNTADGFMGMFGSEKCSTCPDGYRYFNYMINFSGTTQELSDFLYKNQYDLAKLIKDFRRREKELSNDSTLVNFSNGELNDKGLEKLFFDTLKNMGMEGKVNLQKIQDNGTVQNITLDSNGNSTIATTCP
ncbi:hypothetical protein [Chryseobacterium sp. RU33C]|uniref:hypothetical protein n=1 Tax=Chryseobacterium sp. RU33C TaxID=1907398 RepID=UPI000956195E|nr:hypothetical protein [Chryseobacterium sp. RU33C]SIR73086.1 hypothetical protein SAMN05880573_13915 [Chryseobacterium sp. RU33C]